MKSTAFAGFDQQPKMKAADVLRFEKRIFVGLPELDSRLQLLQKFLSKTKTASDVNWDEIAESTEGFSGDDLKRLAREVAFLQFRRYKESHAASQSDSGCVTVSQAERIPVSAADFHEVLQSFSPSVSPISLQRYDDYKSS
uniref:Meiotic spindle formation protein mei-1 n=1 Tax=Ascaris suum TaxID=6253 RepID=F1LGS9_ASCSU